MTGRADCAMAVRVLRHAAEDIAAGGEGWIYEAAEAIGASEDAAQIADEAWNRVDAPSAKTYQEEWRGRLLRAAELLEKEAA